MTDDHLNWIVLITVNLTMPAVMAWEKYSRSSSFQTILISAVISCVLANALVLQSIRSRMKRRGVAIKGPFLAAAVAIAVASVALTVLAVVLVPSLT